MYSESYHCLIRDTKKYNRMINLNRKIRQSKIRVATPSLMSPSTLNSVEEHKKIPPCNKSSEVMKMTATETKIRSVSQVRCDHTHYTSIAEARNNYKKVIATLKSVAPKVTIDKPDITIKKSW